MIVPACKKESERNPMLNFKTNIGKIFKNSIPSRRDNLVVLPSTAWKHKQLHHQGERGDDLVERPLKIIKTRKNDNRFREEEEGEIARAVDQCFSDWKLHAF